jgi:hypothetical protein
MSSEGATRTGLAWVAGLLGRTRVAVFGTLGRRDGRAVLAVVSVGYLALYLVSIGHLGYGDGTVGLLVVEDPLARATERVAPFQYEPVALVSLGPLELLFAPVNAALGAALAVLVGVNLAVSWVAWRGPEACRIGPGAGVAAAAPGLLSGVACCGPAVLLVLGVQASAGLLAAFQWLLPAAALLLLVTLVWVGTRVESAPPGA